MALCPACLPADVAVQSVPATSIKESLPTMAEVKGGFTEAVDESKQMFEQGRTWLKNDLKAYTNTKNWNIKFDKTGSIALAKDTVLAVLPLLILGFISAKILAHYLPKLNYLSTDGLGKAGAFWMLNFALGIGITLSASLKGGFETGSDGGTVRLIASGVTILLTYLLIRKSRARAAEGSFTFNPQSEIVGTAALLSTISLFLTSLTSSLVIVSYNGSLDNVSKSISVDFYSLLIGPLIISTITVLLGSYAVKTQKKISDSLNQAGAFLVGATAVATVVSVLIALKDRELRLIPMFLVVAPTAVLAGLVAASGVPLINTFSDKQVSLLRAGDGTPIDITHPTFSLVLYFGLLLVALLLIGTAMGFRIDPRTYTARSSIRIILTITGIVLLLNFFFMFYTFGTENFLYQIGLGDGSKSIAVFAHPLYLIPASLMWGAFYVFGARYLTPFAAQIAPSLVAKVLPKLRISISDFYSSEPVKVGDLTPLQQQTKTMQADKAKSIAKKGALVVLAFFIITGPANHAIANKISSPSSAVSGFFNALTANDSGAALSHVILSEDEISKDFLTDQVLKNYIHKPKVKSIVILQSDAEYATAHVEYTINGETYGSDISLEKDLQQKLYKIFPVWKISQGVMRTMEINGYDGKSVTLANAAVPAKAATVYLFPGTIHYSLDNPIYFNKFDYIMPVDPNENMRSDSSDSGLKADASVYIEKRVRAIIAECNKNSEKSPEGCPVMRLGGYQLIDRKVFKTIENLRVTSIGETGYGYSFILYFDGVLNFTDPTTGVNRTTSYTYDATTELNKEDGLQAIIWAR